MNNIYVFDIENFSEQDAINAKKLDKSDKVIFLPNKSGMISYSLFPIISAWKTAPTFMQPIMGEKNEQALLFMLTLQCANANGDLYIVMEKNPFYQLDNCVFETEKGELAIHIYDFFEQILSIKSKRRTADKKEKKIAKDNSDENSLELLETASQFEVITDDDSNSMDNSGEVNSIEKNIYMGLESDEKYSQASEKFIEILKNLENQTSMDLMSVKNALANAISNTYEDVLGGLDFQIELRFKKEYVKPICTIIEPVFNKLKEVV